MMILPPILITSSAIPMETSGKLNDPESRIHHTLEGIEQWLQISPQLKLVICDGSGFDFTERIRQRFPEASIECLNFLNDREMVLKKSKGYGEGVIIQYALAHSTYLKDADYFAKCTGKLWVDNFLECLGQWNGQCLFRGHFKNVFSFKKIYLEHVDTRFYLMNKKIYQSYFADLYLNLGEVGHTLGIEDEFRDAIVLNKMQSVFFSVRPIIQGVGGGVGAYYRNDYFKRIKEEFKHWVVKMIPRFKKLFNAKD